MRSYADARKKSERRIRPPRNGIAIKLRSTQEPERREQNEKEDRDEPNIQPGGRERTEVEFRELLPSAGFDLEDVVATPAPLSILIAKSRETV
jgi:hypothetical protein